FMCVILAAFDMLSSNTELGYSFSPSRFATFVWLAAASILGLVLAVPLRSHYVVEEELTYADGVAAAETVVVLDARPQDARQAALALFLATLVSACLWLLTQRFGGEIFGVTEIVKGKEVFTHVIPEVVFPTFFGLAAANAGAGFALSALAIGSGMIVGNRI